MTWRPHRDPKAVGGFEVQYMTSSTHSHEGGHRIVVAGREVLVLPDGRTTARKRSAVIRDALADLAHDPSTVLETFVGALILKGVINIEVDGVPVVATDELVASLRLAIVQTTSGFDVRLSDLGAT